MGFELHSRTKKAKNLIIKKTQHSKMTLRDYEQQKTKIISSLFLSKNKKIQQKLKSLRKMEEKL